MYFLESGRSFPLKGLDLWDKHRRLQATSVRHQGLRLGLGSVPTWMTSWELPDRIEQPAGETRSSAGFPPVIHGFRSAVLSWSSGHWQAPACVGVAAVRATGLEVRGQKNVNYVLLIHWKLTTTDSSHTWAQIIYSDEEYKYFPNKKGWSTIT